MQHSTRQIAAEIQRYCSTHPLARDTVEGITWWVEMQRQEEFAGCVADAVHLLVKEGVLERLQLQDGTEIYGCAKLTRSDQTTASRNPDQ